MLQQRCTGCEKSRASCAAYAHASPLLLFRASRPSAPRWIPALQGCHKHTAALLSTRHAHCYIVRSSPENGSEAQHDASVSGFRAKETASDSTPAFLAKLFGVSLLASIAVKYGSLLSDLPFQPSAAIAVSFIVVPTLVFSAVIAAKSSQ